MKATTVPAATVAQLGGLQDGDPAVRWRGGEGFEASWHPSDSHDRGWPEPDARVLGKQSEGALLRVLARHLGWDGKGLLVLRDTPPYSDSAKSRWCVYAEDKRGSLSPDFCMWLPAHISTDLDYTAALAAAVVWFARLERVRAGSDATVVLAADLSADLEAIEASFGLDLWRVEVTP